jgi:hypothetical protein
MVVEMMRAGRMGSNSPATCLTALETNVTNSTVQNARETRWMVVEFLRPSFVWAGALTLIAATWNVVSFPNVALRPGNLEELLPNLFTTFLIVTTFAGGVSLQRLAGPHRSWRAVTLGGLSATIVVFVVGSYVVPNLEYRGHELAGRDVAQYAPFGPATPSGMLKQLRYLRANPPTVVNRSVETPRAQPINWTEFLLHAHFVLPLFSLLSGFAGLFFAQITSGIRSSRRLHLRWIFGVFVFVAISAPFQPIRVYLSSHPSGSGAVGAWMMLGPSLILVLVLWIGVRVQAWRLDKSAPSDLEA